MSLTCNGGGFTCVIHVLSLPGRIRSTMSTTVHSVTQTLHDITASQRPAAGFLCHTGSRCGAFHDPLNRAHGKRRRLAGRGRPATTRSGHPFGAARAGKDKVVGVPPALRVGGTQCGKLRTSNTERPTSECRSDLDFDVRRSMFNVGCSSISATSRRGRNRDGGGRRCSGGRGGGRRFGRGTPGSCST